MLPIPPFRGTRRPTIDLLFGFSSFEVASWQPTGHPLSTPSSSPAARAMHSVYWHWWSMHVWNRLRLRRLWPVWFLESSSLSKVEVVCSWLRWFFFLGWCWWAQHDNEKKTKNQITYIYIHRDTHILFQKNYPRKNIAICYPPKPPFFLLTCTGKSVFLSQKVGKKILMGDD